MPLGSQGAASQHPDQGAGGLQQAGVGRVDQGRREHRDGGDDAGQEGLHGEQHQRHRREPH